MTEQIFATGEKMKMNKSIAVSVDVTTDHVRKFEMEAKAKSHTDFLFILDGKKFEVSIGELRRLLELMETLRSEGMVG